MKCTLHRWLRSPGPWSAPSPTCLNLDPSMRSGQWTGWRARWPSQPPTGVQALTQWWATRRAAQEPSTGQPPPRSGRQRHLAARLYCPRSPRSPWMRPMPCWLSLRRTRRLPWTQIQMVMRAFRWAGHRLHETFFYPSPINMFYRIWHNECIYLFLFSSSFAFHPLLFSLKFVWRFYIILISTYRWRWMRRTGILMPWIPSNISQHANASNSRAFSTRHVFCKNM